MTHKILTVGQEPAQQTADHKGTLGPFMVIEGPQGPMYIDPRCVLAIIPDGGMQTMIMLPAGMIKVNGGTRGVAEVIVKLLELNQ